MFQCCHRLYDRDRVKERAVLRDFLGLSIPFDVSAQAEMCVGPLT
jgi:hypothetical protein